MSTSIHPFVDNGIAKGSESFPGGVLRCRCSANKVEVRVDSQVEFNHACGCTKCWKPSGALFSIVGVVPKDKVHVTAHGEKLRVVDQTALIQRHACTDCGTHMFGRIENKAHAFYGLDFIHTELSNEQGWKGPEFAAFVSSIIESGAPASRMDGVRQTLLAKGLQPYDCLNPNLMDLLASHAAKAKGTFREA